MPILSELARHSRPREKLLTKGALNLTDVELLAVLLHTGRPGKHVKNLAATVLEKYSLQELSQISLDELRLTKGIGPHKSTVIKAALELGQRVTHHQLQPSLLNPASVALRVQELLHYRQEHLVGLYLDGRYQLLSQQTISIGTLNSSLIHAREVFAPAVELRAAAVILVHNHPSGDTQPSLEDIETTQQIVAAGDILDIPILDHVIVSSRGWLSMQQQQLLD
jgi:DNA repair protein RadC